MAKKKSIKDISVPKIVLEPAAKSDSRYIRCRVLIVCEGAKTEPNYFKSFDQMKNRSSFVFEVTSDGGGINTKDVVDEAIRLRDEAKSNGRPFDTVWAVFDKDSFDSAVFDNAINKAEANKINCAWSNEAFELWYVYHFDDRSTAMQRNEYKKVITQRVCANGIQFQYKKNDPNMRKILSDCGCDEHLAIKRAERQADSFTDRRYHTHNPSTMVYKLVRLLIGEDQDFNNQIKKGLAKK